MRLPLIGHGLPLLRHPLRFVTSLRGRGDVVRIYLGTTPVHVVTTPELARAVLVGEAGTFGRDNVAEAVRPMFGHALATLAGSEHLQRRRQLAPSFHPTRIADYVPVMARLAHERACSWRRGQRIAFDVEAFELSLATIATTLFTSSLGTAAVAEIHRSLPLALKELPRRVLLPAVLRANRRFDTAAARLRTVFRSVIEEYRATGADHGDLLSSLLFPTAAMADDEVVDELMGLLVAGVDTPAAAVSWVFHELGQHPDIEARLHVEVDSVLGGGPVSLAEVRRLHYTRRVIQEVLRVYPPWINLLQARSAVRLGETRLEPGAVVAVSPYLLHHDEDQFTEPARFDPDRWLPDRAAALGRDRYLPFSLGVRKCPGEGFALVEMTVQVATIAAHWRLLPASSRQVRAITRGVVVHPDRLPMITEAR